MLWRFNLVTVRRSLPAHGIINTMKGWNYWSCTTACDVFSNIAVHFFTSSC